MQAEIESRGSIVAVSDAVLFDSSRDRSSTSSMGLSKLFLFLGRRYANNSSVREPGRNSVKHKSYNGCLVGTHFAQTLPKNAAEINVPRIPPLGTSLEICIPNKDEPTIAKEAPVVGCSASCVEEGAILVVAIDASTCARVPILLTVGNCVDELVSFCS